MKIRSSVLIALTCSLGAGPSFATDTTRDAEADALVDARRSARRLRRFEQALDHPVLPTIPETEYFKGFLLEMMPGR